MTDFNLLHLTSFQFPKLFNELGWDNPAQQQPYTVAVGEIDYALEVVAHKKGVQILHCQPDNEGHIPDYATRQKIERKITAEVREHLIVFTDAAQTTQIWQWVARDPGRPNQYREVSWRHGDVPELLKQKLSAIAFSLSEEESLTVLGVTQRLGAGFDRDKVTKKFYTEFDKQRKAFTDFIEGIPKLGKEIAEDQRWYTAVLIDRLMFLWFLQEKLFLDGKKDYLQSRLAAHLAAQLANGSDTSFYRAFLSPLFFSGFAEERTPTNRAAIAARFGSVPYLNGGLFAQHQLEAKYGQALDVEDAAFEKLFAFFDQWDWHLDDRPLAKGNEVNPDVLGYIFEKFVNQKQMGAYYTKEDITEYIGKNTIIPCLLAKVRAEHPGAFDALAWPLLQQSGDAYIYPAMLKGMPPLKDRPPLPGGEGWGEGASRALPTYPAAIANGLDPEAPNLLERRKPWNKRADDAASLPTEIWRETIARHQRTRDVRAKIASGDLREIGDLITYNLNIRQFAQDLIERCTDVALLKSFWFNLAGRLPRKSNEKFRHGLSVLDPTCGSGAFLFAALNILKPLYDATLRTLQAVRTDAVMAGQSDMLVAGKKPHPEKWAEVDELLERFSTEREDRIQSYAVIKHIIVHNLYGVDIEEQATEIAKLRLFLKLVALLEPGDDIEPLPDIDFNIRHGNTLVGYATADETERAVKGATQTNLFDDAWEDIRLRLIAVETQYDNFQIQQVQRGGHVSATDKQALTDTLHNLEETLNYHLAKEYGVDPTRIAKYEAWKASHQPFHWYVDFYPLIAAGGFDVVIGNPPYVEYSKVKSHYEVKSPTISVETGNLYAFTTQRCFELSRSPSYIGMIVPVSLVSTQRMLSLQSQISHEGTSWYSNYGERPAKLFSGAEVLLTIVIVAHGVGRDTRFVTGLRKWSAEQRDTLFPTTCYAVATQPVRAFVVPKFSDPLEKQILEKMWSVRERLGASLRTDTDAKLFYRIGGGRYWKVFTATSPRFVLNGNPSKSSRESTLTFGSAAERDLACAVLSSSTFFWHFSITTNGRDLNPIDLHDFPVNLISIEDSEPSLSRLTVDLMTSYQVNSRMKTKESSRTGSIEYQEFYPRISKALIDEIDKALARYYDLTAQHLDYIINYDIKYRMGKGGDDDSDD